MRIHVEDILSSYYDVIDVPTNTRIKLCIRADDKSGYYEIYKLNTKREIVFDETTQKYDTMLLKGNIKIIRKVSYIKIFFCSMIAIYKELLGRYRYEKKYGRKI